MFERLEFVYLPSRDCAADVARFVDGLGAELVFAIQAFGTRVAMVQPGSGPPALLLAEHLEGDRPVLLYRVANLDEAVAELAARGVEVGERFGFPHGTGAEARLPGPQRVAIYEETRPEAREKLAGRRDF